MITVRRTVLSVLSVWHGLAAFKNLCDLGAAFGAVPAAARWRSLMPRCTSVAESRCWRSRGRWRPVRSCSLPG